MKTKSLAFTIILSTIFIACSQNNDNASSDQASDDASMRMSNNATTIGNTDIPYLQFYDNKTFSERDAWSNPFKVPKDTMTGKISNASYDNTSLCFTKFGTKKETCTWKKLKDFAVEDPTTFKWNASQSAWFILYGTEAKFKSRWENILQPEIYDGKTIIDLQIVLSNISDASRSSIIAFKVSNTEALPNSMAITPAFYKDINLTEHLTGSHNIPLNLNSSTVVVALFMSDHDDTYVSIYDIKDAAFSSEYGIGSTNYYNLKDLAAKYPSAIVWQNGYWVIALETVDKLKSILQDFVNKDTVGNTAYYKISFWTRSTQQNYFTLDISK